MWKITDFLSNSGSELFYKLKIFIFISSLLNQFFCVELSTQYGHVKGCQFTLP